MIRCTRIADYVCMYHPENLTSGRNATHSNITNVIYHIFASLLLGVRSL